MFFSQPSPSLHFHAAPASHHAHALSRARPPSLSPSLCVCLPFNQILVDLAELQDEEVGDGTTSVVIVAAELLRRANVLVRHKVHPTSVISGYRLAMREVSRMRSRERGWGEEGGREREADGGGAGRAPFVCAFFFRFSHQKLTTSPLRPPASSPTAWPSPSPSSARTPWPPSPAPPWPPR